MASGWTPPGANPSGANPADLAPGIPSPGAPERGLQSGDRVRLCQSPPYLKTADPMPMLRSAGELPVGSVGMVRDRRPGGVWAVRFDQGAYLLGPAYLERLPHPPQP